MSGGTGARAAGDLAPGAGGLPRLTLTGADGARAELYLYGAHVTSWSPAGAGEQLFVSERSEYRAGAAIRGGIPVIFPQFGPGPLPKHGFARTSAWELTEAAPAADGGAPARATLRLRDTESTRAIWPHAFAAELAVEVGGRALAVSLGISNDGAAPLAFTAALHTYLRVRDVAAATVEGLAGVRYIDQAAGGVEAEDDAEVLRIAGEVDRLYVGAPARLLVRDGPGADARTIEVRADGFPDAVVWNPGPDKARLLADLGDDEYRRMLCVEAAAAARPVTIAPGETWTGRQTLTLR